MHTYIYNKILCVHSIIVLLLLFLLLSFSLFLLWYCHCSCYFYVIVGSISIIVMLFILVIRSIVVTIVIAILRPEHSNGTCWQLLSWLICSEISAYDRVLLLRYVLSRAVRGSA